MKNSIWLLLLGLIFMMGCASVDQSENTNAYDHDRRWERMSHDRSPRGL